MMQLPEFAPILQLEVCDSTQTVLAEHLQQNRGIPGKWQLATAQQQTAGRGRTGSQWLANPGDAVLMTLAAQLHLPVEKWPRASLVAGLAAAEVLGMQVKLKWPNDLFVLEQSWKKLGGILCERLETPSGAWWLCGIGVNLRNVPEMLENQACALETQERAEEVATRLALRIQARIQEFVQSQGQLPLQELHQRLAFLGDVVEMQDGHRGEIQGLADDGGLRVGDRVLHAGSIVEVVGGVAWRALGLGPV